MRNEYLKGETIARCMKILENGEIRIFRFAGMYTVKDRFSGDKIFEIKSAEYCDSDAKQNNNCKCLVADGVKFTITEKDALWIAVETFYDNQPKQIAKESEGNGGQHHVLTFLDKYIYR